MNAFDDDRKVPGVADPTEILPTHHRLLKSGADIGVRHCSLSGNDDVWELHQPTIGDEARQPSGFCQKLSHERQHLTKFAGQELLDAIPKITFALTGHWRIDCDDKGRVPGGSRTFDGCERAVPTSDQIELIPDRPLRRSGNILQTAARKS